MKHLFVFAALVAGALVVGDATACDEWDWFVEHEEEIRDIWTTIVGWFK